MINRGFPRPILPDIKSVARDVLQAKLVKGTRGEVKIFISREVVHNFIVFIGIPRIFFVQNTKYHPLILVFANFSLKNCGFFIIVYSVMQSDGNSFYGDVVLDSFNMVYIDEDSILDERYVKRIFWDLYYKDFQFEE